MRERPLARIVAAAIAPGKPSAQQSDGRSMRWRSSLSEPLRVGMRRAPAARAEVEPHASVSLGDSYTIDHPLPRDPPRSRRALRRAQRAVRRCEHRHRGHHAHGRVLRVPDRLRPAQHDRQRTSLALGIVVAVFVGALLGLAHAWLTVSVRADQIIAGTMMNIAAFGVTGYLNRLVITPSGLGGAGVIVPFHLPDSISNLPLVGPILVMFLDQGPIAMSVLFIVVALQLALFRTKWGLRTRAVGQHPKAADTVGIDVYRQRYQNVIFGCALAGLAGAFLTLESTGSFQNGMTGGRGFIALAAMIFGRWTPIGAFGGALLFGTATALGVVVNVRVPEGDLGTVLKSIPTFWYAALPYLMTIVILAGVVGRSTPPAADGVPYVKEGKG
jgi:simple sugar transport system permease protein